MSFLRSLRPNFGFHLFFTSFHLEFLSFWVSRLFDLSDLGNLRDSPAKYFEYYIKFLHYFQGLIWRIYHISANSFRGNYSFLNLTLFTVTFGNSTYRCGNYSRGKLFPEIRYCWGALKLIQIFLPDMCGGIGLENVNFCLLLGKDNTYSVIELQNYFGSITTFFA